ncbi:hypothetical protein POM88_029410 [Heracleum sosnowskyi]|uniref:Uncharacterized protein n=1 Tax=Heracleum sosnowskyi TaxID=360622 RepID=A0AAD8MHQ1_9APIA|nr:hypothetical protein POM88_029410 [Heracleum sosnowskyi]
MSITFARRDLKVAAVNVAGPLEAATSVMFISVHTYAPRPFQSLERNNSDEVAAFRGPATCPPATFSSPPAKVMLILLVRSDHSELLGMKNPDRPSGGEDEDSVYVDELGKTMSKHEIVKCLVLDKLVGAIGVDWRDIFPYLYWIPNRNLKPKSSTWVCLGWKLRNPWFRKLKYKVLQRRGEITLREANSIDALGDSCCNTRHSSGYNRMALYELAKHPK